MHFTYSLQLEDFNSTFILVNIFYKPYSIYIKSEIEKERKPLQGCVTKLVSAVSNWNEWALELSISETKDKTIYLPALVLYCHKGFKLIWISAYHRAKVREKSAAFPSMVGLIYNCWS